MLGVLIGVAAVMAVGIFWGGYVAATLWGWFMVPLGVSAIGYWHAVGLGSLMAAFGLGGSSGSNTNRPYPVDVGGLTSGVKEFALGSSHSCAITTTGGRLQA